MSESADGGNEGQECPKVVFSIANVIEALLEDGWVLDAEHARFLRGDRWLSFLGLLALDLSPIAAGGFIKLRGGRVFSGLAGELIKVKPRKVSSLLRIVEVLDAIKATGTAGKPTSVAVAHRAASMVECGAIASSVPLGRLPVDGTLLVPLPAKMPPVRDLSHPAHDFVGGLYRPWLGLPVW